MSGELTVIQQQALATMVANTSITDVIKPLQKEIFLDNVYVAGTSHLDDMSVLQDVKEGVKLNLRREDNRYDELAILVLNGDTKIGYIPEKDNRVFARLMDAGKCLTAQVISVMDKEFYYSIKIGVYIQDI